MDFSGGTLLLHVISALAGFLAMVSGGFWGLGGGWLVVPALLLMGVDYQTTVAASLLQMAPSTFLTVAGQVREIGWGKGSWGMRVALPLCAATFIGSLFGSPLGRLIEKAFSSRTPHEIMYFCLLSWIIWKTFADGPSKHASADMPSPPEDLRMGGACAAGLGIGAVASMLGIGGGIVTRPLLANILHVPERMTAMITRLAIFLTACAGCASYLLDSRTSRTEVLGLALSLTIGGCAGFWAGAWMHGKVLNAGGASKAGRSFAVLASLVAASLLCKIAGLIYTGRVLVTVAGLGLTFYLIHETWKAHRATLPKEGSA